MPPQAIQLGLFVIEEAITNEPAIAAAISKLFSKGIPTAQDWTDLRASVASGDYKAYVPDTALTPDQLASE
ncbi:MAG TPA: hypothetical protein VG167_15020 [Verrucomicrobiae bacterium]|nr:hypothetical protein [Verrucomicrobiae bacterium]